MLAVLTPVAETFTPGASTSRLEFIVIGAIVVLLIVVLALRATRDRRTKVRRGASEGYYDRDLARYTQSAASTNAGRTPVDPGVQPISPTFSSAPKGSRRQKGKGKGGTPVAPQPVPSFGSVDLAHAGPVPAFDQGAAHGLRPVPKMPPPPPPGSVPPPPPPPGSAGSVPPPPPPPPPSASPPPPPPTSPVPVPGPLPSPPPAADSSPAPPGALPPLPPMPGLDRPLPVPPASEGDPAPS